MGMSGSASFHSSEEVLIGHASAGLVSGHDIGARQANFGQGHDGIDIDYVFQVEQTLKGLHRVTAAARLEIGVPAHVEHTRVGTRVHQRAVEQINRFGGIALVEFDLRFHQRHFDELHQGVVGTLLRNIVGQLGRTGIFAYHGQSSRAVEHHVG